MMNEGLGQLAAALAKAQGSFATVKRDKEVTVKTKTGGEYRFKYAPLETIFDAVRKPLADNGLVVVQMLDDGDLITTLLHESGAVMSGRVALPTNTDIQGYGSAVTYLRRYAIQALLGIAAEEDDDGNRAVGNEARFGGRREPEGPTTTHADGLIGTAIIQGKQDGQLRPGPNGGVLPFRVKAGRLSQIVVAEGDLATALDLVRDDWLDKRVTVWGSFTDESFNKGDEVIAYKVLHLERIATPDWTLPAPAGATETPAEPVEAPSAPLFDDMPLSDEERAAIAGGLS